MKLCSSIEKHSAPIEVVLSVRQCEFFAGQAALAHAAGRRGADIAEEKSLWPSQHFLRYFDSHIRSRTAVDECSFSCVARLVLVQGRSAFQYNCFVCCVEVFVFALGFICRSHALVLTKQIMHTLMLSFPCLVLAEVQNLKVLVVKALRAYHGRRIKRDRGGESAVETALRQRLAWGRGDWIQILNPAVGLLRGQQRLFHLAAFQQDPAASGTDAFLVETLEALVRVFIGLVARNMFLWKGSYWSLVLLLSDQEEERDQAADQAVHLWRNTLFLEEIVSQPGQVDDFLKDLAQQCIWKDIPAHRELHTLLLQGNRTEAKAYAQRMHSAIVHEKGHAKG
jgi:hypothetical protein